MNPEKQKPERNMTLFRNLLGRLGVNRAERKEPAPQDLIYDLPAYENDPPARLTIHSGFNAMPVRELLPQTAEDQVIVEQSSLDSTSYLVVEPELTGANIPDTCYKVTLNESGKFVARQATFGLELRSYQGISDMVAMGPNRRVLHVSPAEQGVDTGLADGTAEKSEAVAWAKTIHSVREAVFQARTEQLRENS